MARARPTPPQPWTVGEFFAWEREQEERYEYAGGVIRMMVGGTLDHNTIAGNVFSGLRSQIRGGSGQSDVVPEPEIVVEVLSRSTRGFDRGPKLDASQQIPSLKQYVLIAQEEIRVSVYQRDDGGWRYRILQEPDARLDLVVGGATLTLAEIYQGATIAERTTRQSG